MQLINELLRIPSLQQWGYLLQISHKDGIEIANQAPRWALFTSSFNSFHRSICSWSSFGPYTPKNNCSKLSSTFWNRHEMEYLPESYLLHIPPPPTKKNTARNHACSDFYHFCLLNAHQITSPFMHIISNYILGVSGGNGIQEALRIAISPFLSLRLFSFLLFLNGVWLYLLFLVFPFLGCLIIVLWFLDVFASFVHFLCTGLCSFNKLLNYLSKTNKKPISLFLGSFIPHIFREMILISLILLKKPYHLPIF